MTSMAGRDRPDGCWLVLAELEPVRRSISMALGDQVICDAE